MKKLALFLLCMIGLLLAGCELTPDYVGIWVDATTLALAGTVVTFDLEADAATITIDNVGDDVVVVGTLEKSGSTLTATITQITVGTTVYSGTALDLFLAAMIPPLTRVNTFTYSVVGDTLTITGDLILALTAAFPGGAKDTLVATRT